VRGPPSPGAPPPGDAGADDAVKGPAAAFGLAAAVALLFNAALVWAEAIDKDLADYLTSLSGDLWRSHSFAVVVVFVAVGYVFLSRRQRVDGARLALALAAASLIGALAVAPWGAPG